MNRDVVLVTGASGFVGSAVMRYLEARGRPVLGASRSPDPSSRYRTCPALDERADWSSLVSGIAVVIHAAARVHVMRDTAADPLTEFRRANVQGTLRLARQAAGAGVRRFVFVSSIKVNGEETAPGRPFTAADRPEPADSYGVSKLEAERGLQQISAETGMEVVIVRPPLVYGPGVGANFRRLMRWVHKGVPLPFGAVRNRRSLVALDNLVDLIDRCIDHPAAAGRVLLVSDGEDLSTPELLRRVGRALGRPARLLSIPPLLLSVGGAALGKRDLVRRLCGSLQIDASATRALLGWAPTTGVDDALRRTAQHFLAPDAR